MMTIQCMADAIALLLGRSDFSFQGKDGRDPLHLGEFRV